MNKQVKIENWLKSFTNGAMMSLNVNKESKLKTLPNFKNFLLSCSKKEKYYRLKISVQMINL